MIHLQLPKQEKELEVAEIAEQEQAQAIADSGSNSVVSVIVFNILTSGAMSQIWGMINSMQLYVYLPSYDLV